VLSIRGARGRAVTERQRRRHCGRPAAILAAASLVLLASCASVPERPTANWLGVLPGDSTLFVSLAVQPSAAMIKKALDAAGPDYADVKSLVDMTKRLFISVRLEKGRAPRYWAVALGGYPSTIIGWRLGGNRDWRPGRSSSGSWYESARMGLQVSAPADSVLLLSNGAIEQILPNLKSSGALPLPPDVAADMERSDLVLYFPQLPGSITERGPGGYRIPIREVWVDARREKGSYALGGTANLETEKEARLFSLVVKLGLVAWLRSQVADPVERLKTVSVRPEGAQLVVSGLSFTEDEILPVFLSLISPAPAPEAPPVPAEAGS
jgi:hypothetical protein